MSIDNYYWIGVIVVGCISFSYEMVVGMSEYRYNYDIGDVTARLASAFVTTTINALMWPILLVIMLIKLIDNT